MGAAHTAVSYDGVTVSNCQAGQIDIGRFSLDNVSMLSLAIGQNEDMLQSARLYASAGVLNIEIEKPHFTNERNYAFQTQIKGGSFGYVSPSVRWWQKINKRTRLSVDGMFLRADGNYPFILVNGKYMTKKNVTIQIFTVCKEKPTYIIPLKMKASWMSKVTIFIPNEDFREPSLYIIPLLMKHYGMKNAFIQARYKKHFHPNGVCKHKPSIIMDGISMKIWGAEYTNGVYHAKHRQDEYYLSATVLYHPMTSLSVALAQDGSVNMLRSNLPDCPFPTRYTSQTALNIRYQQGFITATGTLINTFITESVEEGEKPKDFNRLAPSVSVSLQPWKDESLYLRLMYKKYIPHTHFQRFVLL